MKLKNLLFTVLTTFTIFNVSYGKDKCLPEKSITLSKVKEVLKQMDENVKPVFVSPSPIKSLYEVIIDVGDKKLPVYIDCSLNYIVSGEIIDIKRKKSITRERYQQLMIEENKTRINNLKKALGEKKFESLKNAVGIYSLSRFTVVDLKNLPSKGEIIYGNKNSELKIIVITDPQCPFCKKLHNSIKEVLKEKNVNFQIVMFPLPSHRYANDLAQTLVCQSSNEEAKKLLDEIFENQNNEYKLMEIIKKYKCSEGENILSLHKKFAEEVETSGTPTIIFIIGNNKGLKISGAYSSYDLGQIIDALK